MANEPSNWRNERRRDEEQEREEELREVDQLTTENVRSVQEPGVLLETETPQGESYPLQGNDRLEQVSAGVNADIVVDEMAEFTDDQEILDDFRERQEMPIDEQGLQRRLRQHHSETPILTGGDLDAAWDQGEDAGDETVSAEPTPDKDRVDEMGRAMGLTYEDDEVLDFDEKIRGRDDERWELDPASAEEEDEESENR